MLMFIEIVKKIKNILKSHLNCNKLLNNNLNISTKFNLKTH